MQRTLITLLAILFLAITGAANAQSLEKVFDSAKKLPNHEIINLNASMMGMANFFGGANEQIDANSDIKNICVLSLDDCSESDKSKIVTKLKKGGFKDYEMMTNRTQGKELNQVWTKRKGNNISTMIIINIDEEEGEVGMVRLEGKFEVKRSSK